MKQIQRIQTITNRDSQSLDLYFNEISKIKVMTPEQEKIVSKSSREGDLFAREKLIKSNLRFAVTVAKQYQSTGVPLSTLISEANDGLIEAAEGFDERLGNKFISYAVWWLRQRITQFLSENRIVRIPLNRVSHIGKYNKFVEKSLKVLGREPTMDETMDELEISEKDYLSVIQSISKPVSMDKSFTEEESATLNDTLPSDMYDLNEVHHNNSRTEAVKQIFSTLSEREIDILKAHYGFGGCTLNNTDEVVEKYGIHKERVRQIREKAIKKIRSKSGINNFVEYL